MALARAVILEPEVLLLDEPMAALDLKLRKEMQVEVKNLQERLKITFIFVTHDQDEALIMSDRIAVMNQGRIEQVGAPEELYERPRTRFVADFLAVRNILEATVQSVAGGRVRLVTKGGTTIVAKDDGGYAAAKTVWIGVRPEQHRARQRRREQFCRSPRRRDLPGRLDRLAGARGRRAAHRGRGRHHRPRPQARRRRQRLVSTRGRAPPRRRRGGRAAMRGLRRQAILLLLPCLLALLLLFLFPQLLMFVTSLGRRSAYGGVVRALSSATTSRALEPDLPAHPGAQLGPRLLHDGLCLLIAYPVAYWLGVKAPARGATRCWCW